MEEKLKQVSKILMTKTAKVLGIVNDVEQGMDQATLLYRLDKIYEGRYDKSKLEVKANQLTSLVQKYQGNLYEDTLDWLIFLVNEGTELMPEKMFFDFMDYMVTKRTEVVNEKGEEVWKDSWAEYVKKSDVVEDSQMLVAEMDKEFAQAAARKKSTPWDVLTNEMAKESITALGPTRMLSKKIPLEFLDGLDWKEEKVKAKKDKGEAILSVNREGASIHYFIDWGVKPDKPNEKYRKYHEKYTDRLVPEFKMIVHEHEAKSFIAGVEKEGNCVYLYDTIYQCDVRNYWITIFCIVGSDNKENAEKGVRNALKMIKCH